MALLPQPRRVAQQSREIGQGRGVLALPHPSPCTSHQRCQGAIVTFPGGTRAGGCDGGSGDRREAGAAPGEAQGGVRCVISLGAGENSHFHSRHRALIFTPSSSVLSQRRSRSHLSLLAGRFPVLTDGDGMGTQPHAGPAAWGG